MSTLSIVIPAYNEERAIGAVLERVRAVGLALQEAGFTDWEVIVVDDGSRDRTAEIAAAYPEVRLIRHPVNRGYGAALKTGFAHARGEWLAFLDADATYPPESLPDLYRAARASGADMVVGSRMGSAESEMPLVRRIGNWGFAFLLRVLGSAAISDSASGMRLLRRETLERLYPLPDGLNFTPAMSARAIYEGLRMIEVPIPYRERLGQSKLHPLQDGVRFLHAIVWTVMTYNPVRVFGMAGFGLIVAGAGLGLSAFLWPGPGGWPFPRLFAAVVLGALGAHLFAVGTLFNYLVSLFHKRPIRQGLFGRPLFRQPLERRFLPLGLLSVAAGLILYGWAAMAGLTAPPFPAPWFVPAVSALTVLMGVDLITAWILVRALSELSQRELRIRQDLAAGAVTSPTEPLPQPLSISHPA
ncbi:glycosyltransferase family 2 protein [Thermoflexus hugenholtzii]|uniref:Glycosyltransferase involved in cell wall bisynthesis n=1 Tax=Thermoflexus hugenholtzii JAD2 TaxID=877466 RepID=A0A212PY75_9CHLR|nr:glycosyltransferase family 2 protein [Thermoflexus hugenholtzii]SNB51963.1 Glycosyltransferase involved in cell wall bisynthesis [Thermoflexus hugenholtzii JAD2]